MNRLFCAISILITMVFVIGIYEIGILPKAKEEAADNGYAIAKFLYEPTAHGGKDTLYTVKVKRVWFKTTNYVKLTRLELNMFNAGDVIDIDANTHLLCTGCANTIQVELENIK